MKYPYLLTNDHDRQMKSSQMISSMNPSRRPSSFKSVIRMLLDIIHLIIFIMMMMVFFCLGSYMITGKWTMTRYLWNSLDFASRSRVVPDRMFTLNELSQFKGEQHRTPIYLAIKGVVFDVSRGRRFYGPDGAYHVFAGKDASRAFATGCFAESHQTHDLRGLSEEELEDLDNWFKFYMKKRKYPILGRLESLPVPDDSTPLPPKECDKISTYYNTNTT